MQRQEQTPVKDTVLDTGCSRTMVQAVLVPETKIISSSIEFINPRIIEDACCPYVTREI